MKPILMIFENENIKNEYVTFEKKIKPRIDWDSQIEDEEGKTLTERTAEMYELAENAIFEFYMNENNENSLCSDGDFFPDRTVLTGNYYIGSVSYLKVLKDKNGHPYDKKGDRYRDLWSRDKKGNFTHFVDDIKMLKPTYQVIIETCLTSLEQGVEQDYMGIDFSLEFDNIDDEIYVDILSHNVI